jgi:hypothetical protein
LSPRFPRLARLGKEQHRRPPEHGDGEGEQRQAGGLVGRGCRTTGGDGPEHEREQRRTEDDEVDPGSEQVAVLVGVGTTTTVISESTAAIAIANGASAMRTIGSR